MMTAKRLVWFWMLLLAGCMVNQSAKMTPEQQEKAINARLSAGVEALRSQQPERARTHFNRALEINPDSPLANNAMALLYKYELDLKREEEYYKRALRADSRFAPANNNYGVLLLARGDTGKAIKHFKLAAENEKYDRRSEAFENLGRAYLSLGQLDEAEQSLNRAIRLNANASEAVLGMADVFFQKERYELAWRYHQQYVGMVEQQDARSLYLGVRIGEKTGQTQAVESYRFALERLYPKSREWAMLSAKGADSAR